MCYVDQPYTSPPPLHSWPFWYVGESFLYWVLRISPQYIVLLSLNLVTHWCSPHYHLYHQHHLPSSSYSKKEKVEPFLAVTMTIFPLGLLAFRVVFQLALKCLWPSLTMSSLPPGHHENHLIWVDSSLLASLELAQFRAPLATSHEVQPPAWMSREPSDLSGLDPDSSLWLSVKKNPPPECLLRWSRIYYLCALLYIFAFQLG